MLSLFLRRTLNPLAYRLRQAIAFRRAGYREGPLDPARVSVRLREQFASPQAKALDALGLEAYKPRLAHAAYTKSLFVMEVLGRLHAQRPIALPNGRVLDIGSKNFECAPGLHTIANKFCDASIRLSGVEIDAYPIYRNLHSRADAAEYYLSLLPTHTDSDEHRHLYVAGDVKAITGQFGLITWFFPFLTPSPLLWWGLPEYLFTPRESFRHVLRLLAPGGTLIITNYTPEEAAIQEELLRNAELAFEREVMDDLIGRSGQSVYVFRVRP